MNEILFKEEPMKEERYIKDIRTYKIVLIAFSSFLILFSIYCIMTKDYIVSIILFIFSAIMLIVLLFVVMAKKQYLYIYKDKIICKKFYQKNEQTILINVTDYTIKLLRSYGKGHNFSFKFIDNNGKTILQYRPLSLRTSLYQTDKEEWETDIFNIGCKIDNSEEVIYNVKSYTR